MNRRLSRFALLSAALTLLTACNREVRPSVNPVGLRQGMLTTTGGSSGSQVFTTEISETSLEYANYTGTFTVANKPYNVTGNFSGRYEGEYFAFQAPPRTATDNIARNS